MWVEPEAEIGWRIPDSFDRASSLSCPEVSEELAAVLHSDVVFLGTTPGESAFDRIAGRDDWMPFHAVGRSCNDRVAEALRDTGLWGAFMTDLFHILHIDKSILVSGWLQEPANVPAIKQNFAGFEWLLKQVGTIEDRSKETPSVDLFWCANS